MSKNSEEYYTQDDFIKMGLNFLAGVGLLLTCVVLQSLWADGTLSFTWINENLTSGPALFFGLLITSPLMIGGIYYFGKSVSEFTMYIISVASAQNN